MNWVIHPEVLPFVVAWDAWATLAVGVAAVFGAYRIGLRQVAVAEKQADIQHAQVDQTRLQLRADLYERRANAYSAIRDYAYQATLGNQLPGEVQRSFFEALNVSRFLFGQDIQDWLRQVHTAATQLQVANLRARNVHTAGTEQVIEAVETSYDRLNVLLADLDEKFAPYLGFEEVVRA